MGFIFATTATCCDEKSTPKNVSVTSIFLCWLTLENENDEFDAINQPRYSPSKIGLPTPFIDIPKPAGCLSLAGTSDIVPISLNVVALLSRKSHSTIPAFGRGAIGTNRCGVEGEAVATACAKSIAEITPHTSSASDTRSPGTPRVARSAGTPSTPAASAGHSGSAGRSPSPS